MERRSGPSREEWVRAALEELSRSGVAGVRIERLAAALGVSKGPFYWRFRDRDDLLRSLLAFWREDLTDLLVRQAADTDEPRERLFRLIELALKPTHLGIEVAAAESALRAWAAQDPEAASAARAIDAARVEHVARELRAAGATDAAARCAAKGIYLGLLGLFTARCTTPDLADDDAYRALAASLVERAVDPLVLTATATP